MHRRNIFEIAAIHVDANNGFRLVINSKTN